MTIQNWIHAVWRNYPRGATTFAQCKCGRHSSRGGGLCNECLVEKLTATGKVSVELADEYIRQVRDIRTFEAKLEHGLFGVEL
jgi:hypothetical protein